ncbi:hypothetical protein CGH56_09745, partial [Vibrio parahaemolyticus]
PKRERSEFNFINSKAIVASTLLDNFLFSAFKRTYSDTFLADERAAKVSIFSFSSLETRNLINSVFIINLYEQFIANNKKTVVAASQNKWCLGVAGFARVVTNTFLAILIYGKNEQNNPNRNKQP